MASPNLKGNGINLAKIIKEKVDKPISLNNDAFCAGMAEKVYGNLQGYDNGVFLGLGTGVGTAVFINGELVPEVRSARSYDCRKKWKKVQLWKKGML